MIYVSLPATGLPFGWSVAAGELTVALQSLSEVQVISDRDPPTCYEHPVLHAVQGANFLPLRPGVESSVMDVGYLFIEETDLSRRYVQNAAKHFNRLVTGSNWCTAAMTEIFRGIGIPVTTAPQGVNPRFFEVPVREPDDISKQDRFIVFSGGKAETRKGQDIVIQAMKIFMAAHADVWLNCCWHNPWHVQIPGYLEIAVAMDKLDASRVIGPCLSAVPHERMPEIYAQADIGLFPNRCEAGTNLVMCEFMATGKPVIATYATGHKDVLDPFDCLNLVQNKPLTVKGPDGAVTGTWVEPDLDEVIAMLEFAYDRRDEMRWHGTANQRRMWEFSWHRCARDLLRALGVAEPTSEVGC